MTTLRVLGSAAGGGFPQWNCNCFNCDGLRRGVIAASARTQSSIALSEDGVHWLLVNASPDILAQIRATPALQPSRAARDTGIVAVLLVDAQIDHAAGLLMLREHRSALPVYATPAVLQDLAEGFPLTRILSHYCRLQAHPLALDASPFCVPPLTGLRLHAIALDSKPPPYSPHRAAPQRGDNIGLRIVSASGKRVFYAPGLGHMAPHVQAEMAQADVILVDGSFWSDDEMQRLGLSPQSARDMGHLAQSGPQGMIAALDQVPAARKILIHINNTNPILVDDAPERRELAAHGIEVAHDGMEIAL
ncbi:pyrroloquinoline quinone biosynthesis protein PqqB [Verminephrobacter eiseniae]|uniref:pyrroloquinoline quinone biosynthesis protein PqqB n=1 Tax=Verminephrobacter eiseniae TaxID=364317 RepID=UPI002237146C|nr:pyrroloquinoline quinone biosynthesis protein PqqB [Verminephrobacter eiseniae]MCW5238093.1 pyrroloquinoline quinone biosynthesis protein PqqB [Verminephrobacter eiseniae]